MVISCVSPTHSIEPKDKRVLSPSVWGDVSKWLNPSYPPTGSGSSHPKKEGGGGKMLLDIGREESARVSVTKSEY